MTETTAYVDEGSFDEVPDKSLYVHEGQRSAIIKYRRPDGKPFRVRVVQKPNPIGFRARLPGGRQAT